MYWYYAPYNYYAAWLNSWTKATLLVVGVLVSLLIVYVTVWQPNTDCYQLGLCHSKSLPSVSHFVGREEDIINITGYLDFATSDVQVVHIVGPPGFGKSTLAIKIGEIFLRKWVKVHYYGVPIVPKLTNSVSSNIIIVPLKCSIVYIILLFIVNKHHDLVNKHHDLVNKHHDLVNPPLNLVNLHLHLVNMNLSLVNPAPDLVNLRLKFSISATQFSKSAPESVPRI